MYSDYQQYITGIRDSLIQNGIGFPDWALGDLDNYYNLFRMSLSLEDILTFYRVLSVSGSSDGLNDFYLPIGETYKDKMRNICYNEFITSVLPDYKNLVGGEDIDAYDEEDDDVEFTDERDRAFKNVFANYSDEENYEGIPNSSVEDGINESEVDDNETEVSEPVVEQKFNSRNFLAMVSNVGIDNDEVIEESSYSEDDDEGYEESSYSEDDDEYWDDDDEDEDSSYADSEEEDSWEESSDEDYAEGNYADSDDEEYSEGNYADPDDDEEYEESSYSDSDDDEEYSESNYSDDDEEYEESGYSDSDDEDYEESAYGDDDDDFDESGYGDDEEDFDESGYSDSDDDDDFDESGYGNDDSDETITGNMMASSSDVKPSSTSIRDTNFEDRDLGDELQRITNEALTKAKRGIIKFLNQSK